MVFKKTFFTVYLLLSLNTFSQPADLIKLAETDPSAQFRLGQIFLNGEGLEKNEVEALRWLQKSAESNNADAVAMIGIMHFHGDGVPANKEKAIEYYKRAIKLGSNRGMASFSTLLLNNKNRTKDDVETAHRLLKTAVSNNSPAAKFIMSRYYDQGILTGEDNPKQLFKEAVTANYKDAVIFDSQMTILHNQDPAAIKKAAEYLEKNKGDYMVDTGLANYYLNKSQPKDKEKSKAILRKYPEDKDISTLMLWVQIHTEENNLEKAFRLMHAVNKIQPNTFPVEKYEAEYRKELEAARQLKAEIEREKKFIDILVDTQNQTKSAANDMQRGGIKAARDKQICTLIKDRKVKNWVGYVDSLGANSDGHGVLSIALAPNVYLKTWNNALSDLGSNTLINPDTELFKRASAMTIGQKVRFSGTFVSILSKACLHEASLSLNGSLLVPEFIFKFSDISPSQ